jgi:hypothetical protein
MNRHYQNILQIILLLSLAIITAFAASDIAHTRRAVCRALLWPAGYIRHILYNLALV